MHTGRLSKRTCRVYERSGLESSAKFEYSDFPPKESTPFHSVPTCPVLVSNDTVQAAERKFW